MHARGVTAALMILAWAQLWPGLLMAKPTRTIPRPAALRSIVAVPAQRSSHGRNAHRLANAHAVRRLGIHATSRNASGPTRHDAARATARKSASNGEASRIHASMRIGKRAHTPAHERTRNVYATMAAADRGIRTRPAQEIDSLPESRPDIALAETRTTHLPADGDPMGDDLFTDNHDASADLAKSPFAAPVLPHMKSIEEEASTPILLQSLRLSSLYDSHGRLVVPPPLFGSREILLHQNQMADSDGLDRVRNDADLLELRRAKKLIALPDNETLRVDGRLPENRRFSRPWTAAFLAVLARDYYLSFHQPLQVNSAIRTIQFQQRLLRTNRNAAPSTGDTASPHLTGQAVDIAKHGLSLTQIAWMRAYLQPFIGQGKIDVEEEFRQACFHISVYKTHLPATPSHLTVAAARPVAPATLP